MVEEVNHERFMKNVNRALASRLGGSYYIKVAVTRDAMNRFVKRDPEGAIDLYIKTRRWKDNRAEEFRGIAVGDERIIISHYLDASNVVGSAIVEELGSDSMYRVVARDVKRDMEDLVKDGVFRVYVTAGDDLEEMERRLFANPPRNIFRDDTRNVAKSNLPGIRSR